MQISPPIIRKPDLPTLRVAVIVHSLPNNLLHSRSQCVRRACELLSMVCREAVTIDAVSDTRLPSFDRGGLAACVRAIETGEVDLAIAESCFEITFDPATIRDILQRCIVNGVRFIAFQDQIDTAEPDYAVYLERYLADFEEEDE